MPVYGLRNGSIVLPVNELPIGSNVASIIWKHNKDKAAEWFEGDEGFTYFDKFNSTTKLDNKTWALTISNLQPYFNGMYSVEVNNKDPVQYISLTVKGE